MGDPDVISREGDDEENNENPTSQLDPAPPDPATPVHVRERSHQQVTGHHLTLQCMYQERENSDFIVTSYHRDQFRLGTLQGLLWSQDSGFSYALK